MTERLESLANRFFTTVGVVEPAGYRTIEVVLDESVQPYFGGHEYLFLAFSPEAAHEHAGAEVLTYGSPLLDTMAEVAIARGTAVHFYLKSPRPTTGRTLEKVRAQVRLPGHLMDIEEEQLMLFHHALFRFKLSFIGEEREEVFQDVSVDLHTGWATRGLEEQTLRSYGSTEAAFGRELGLHLSLAQACETAISTLQGSMAAQVSDHQALLRTACLAEKKQVLEHYQTSIARIEAGKTRKGADVERLDARIRATQVDQEMRLQDLEKRYELSLELTLTQLALVSYLKAVVPLRIQQGKEVYSGVAVWDSLTQEGYFAQMPR